MKYALLILGLIDDFARWVIGYGQRQIGRKEQANDDLKAENKALKNELDAAVNAPSAADSLRRHEF